MSARVRSAVTFVLVGLFGRRLAVRAARALSRAARLDETNEMNRNGELMVQRVALEGWEPSPDCERPLVIDAGANVGDWSLALERSARAHRPTGVNLIAFEPSRDTFETLERALSGLGETFHRRAINRALSEKDGEALLHIVARGAGTNSLHHQSDLPVAGVESIQLLALDRFCEQERLGCILLLKIDTEGHELSVLAGARRLLERQRIELIQFEYNQRWIASRHYLRDAFELLVPLGYRIGKITPRGIEFYEAWHFELESWNEGNYLACLPSWVEKFPAVKWWNI